MTRRPVRRARQLLLVMAVSAVVTVGSAGPALAHAELVTSSPAEQDVLSEPPTTLSLVFDEEVDPALSAVVVTGPPGAQVRLGTLSRGANGPTSLAAPFIGAMPAGDYRVSWRVVSVDDGHATAGAFTFRSVAVRAAPAAAVQRTAAAPPSGDRGGSTHVVYGVARWMAFLGFALLVGGGYFLVTCWRRGSTMRAGARLVTGAWCVVFAATAVMFGCYGADVEGRPLGDVVDATLLRRTAGSHVGIALLVRLMLLVVMGVAAAAAWRRRSASRRPAAGGDRDPRRVDAAAVVVGGAALAATWSAVSHSAGGPHSAVMMTVDAVHLVATAVWLGGLAVLGLVVLRRGNDDTARRAVATFSTTAAACVAVIVGTGLVQTWQRVGTVAALTDTAYAQLLLAKAALVTAAVGVAGVVRFRLLRAEPRARAPLRAAVLVEAGLGIGVLGLTSVLVATEPAGLAHARVVAAARAAHESVPAVRTASRSTSLAGEAVTGSVPYDAGAGLASRGTVEVAVIPAALGPTEIHLSVLDARGLPRPVTRLSAALRPLSGDAVPIPVRLTEIAPGHYTSEGAGFPASGRWQLGLLVELPGGAATTAVATIDIAGRR